MAQLDAWIEAFEQGRVDYDGREEARLRALVERLWGLARAHPARASEVDAGLLDLMGVGLHEPQSAGASQFGASQLLGTRAEERVGALGRRALRSRLDAGSAQERIRWLEREVLISPSQPLRRRQAALLLVGELKTTQGKLAVLSVAGRADDPLRRDALEQLAHWPDDLVDEFLVGRLAKPWDRAHEPHPVTLLLERIRSSSRPLGARATDQLAGRIAVMLIDPGWREASRAIALARGMTAERSVPLLIEALGVWSNRTSLGRGSKRIEHDILSELQRMSGRTIGPHPERWFRWWTAVQEGRIELVDEEPGRAPRSEASFFGLRPITDRVTFVIDRSGSMDSPWGTTGRTRYAEAVDQLVRFLQAAGEETKFNVVLFSSEPLLSSRELQSATPARIGAARRSLLARAVDGGTQLRPAIELALAVGRDGRPDLDALEADTVIVLCDGATAEGPSWVEPFLERVNAEARVVFHCVLLGTAGDGTLETLAERTGGDLVRCGG